MIPTRARSVLLIILASLVCVLSPVTGAGADVDGFGVTMLSPTAPGGREWFADWQAPRTRDGYGLDPQDPLVRNSDGTLTIGGGIARSTPGTTRLYVLTPKNDAGEYTAPQWQNVEMTAYFLCGTPTRKVSAQALILSTRSGERHNDDAPCEGTSYHATLRFDGQAGFKKEIWHTGGYTDLRPDPAPRPWPTVPEGRWIGMKHLCRNCDGGRHVKLQLYLDLEENNTWQLVAETTDEGGWEGQRQSCDRAQDFIISMARPAVYLRTDYVPLEVTKFSVREIAPLP
jgi:hypothetical protein